MSDGLIFFGAIVVVDNIDVYDALAYKAFGILEFDFKVFGLVVRK